MKIFCIIQLLSADSGHIITLVVADNADDAFHKYTKKYPHRTSLGIDIKEFSTEVQTMFRYDNPNYEG